MKQLLIRKLINCGIFAIAAFLIECISFLFMWGSLAKYWFLDLMFFFVLSLPIFLSKKHLIDLIYLSIMMIITFVLSCINTYYYLELGDIFSLQYLSYLSKGASVVEASFIDFPHLFTVLGVLLVYIASLYFVVLKVYKKKDRITEKRPNLIKYLSLVSLLTVSLASYIASFNIAINYEKKYNDNYIIDLTTIAKPNNYQTLGMYSYYAKEADYLFSTSTGVGEISDIKKYMSKPVYTDNEYTGLLKGYNVVTIMIETGASIMVNETLTPNLYNMMDKGIDFTNNYCKNKTNVSEYIGIVGTYPTSGIKPKQPNAVPFSIPNLLDDSYRTMYFHDVGTQRDIYSRKTFIPTLGFEETYLHDELLPGVDEWTWNGDYTLDSITVESVLDIILQDTSSPFYAFYTSLSMHGPYTYPKNASLLRSKYYSQLKEAESNNNWVNPLKDDTNGNARCIENYMMAVMDFDIALGKMIDTFKEKGLYDNTLFVLYGDHDVYYNGFDKIPLSFNLFGVDNLQEVSLYNTVMLFYNEKLNETYLNKKGNTTINKFNSINNIVPTVLDLLDVDYNANIYIGDSIFAPTYDNYSVFYSYELSCFFDENYLSVDGLEIDKVFNESATTEKEFLDTITHYVLKQSYIDKIYKGDIFKDHNYLEFNYR